MFKITKHILCVAMTYGLCGCVLDASDIEKITNDPDNLVFCPNDSNKAKLNSIQITKAADPKREGELCSNDECLTKDDCCGLNGKYAEKYYLAFHHGICPENMSCLTENNHYRCGIQQVECSSEQKKCSNACVNLMTDIKHCGKCNSPCDQNTIPNSEEVSCVKGTCTIIQCKTGFHPEQNKTKCEKDTIRTCGPYHSDCYSIMAWGDGDNDYEDNDGYCENGNCYANVCITGYHPYNQTIDSRFVPCQKDDNDNCGAPNHKCVEPTPLCQDGKCIENCTGDMALCESGCVNIRTDIDNCNGCGNKCDNRPNMNVTCNGTCNYSCKDGYGDCDNDLNNGCETLLTDKHWSKCGICESGYKDCDSNRDNGCEINLAENGLSDCKVCADDYTYCGLYNKNNKIASCLKPGKGWDDKHTPFDRFCKDRCNNTKDPLTYETSEAIHHPSVCKPKQYCSRIDDPYPDYYYPCTDQK